MPSKTVQQAIVYVNRLNFPLRATLVAIFFASPLLSNCQSLQPQLASLSLPDAPSPHLLTSEFEQDSSSSQQSSSSTTQAPAKTTQVPLTPGEKKKAAQAELDKELHQRMGGVVPNFNTVLDGSALPLSPRQKMRASFRSAIDPYQFGLAGIAALYGQATDSHTTFDATRNINTGYSQGVVGYLQRYGANFVDQFDGTILGNGVFPILLKQDARYYRKGSGSIPKRLIYAVGTTVRCKGDNGKWQPNYSNLLGNLAAGGISNLYYPPADRGFGLTIEQGLTVTAEGSIGAMLVEFYPDLLKHFRKKHPMPDTASGTTPALAGPKAK